MLKPLQELEDLWINILIRLGLADKSRMNDLLTHAFDIQDGRYAAEYVAKLGHTFIDDQRSTRKLGSRSTSSTAVARTTNRLPGKSPFDLLYDYRNGDYSAGNLFVEFATCFKGKRQLFWSRGLRQKMGISLPEKSDDEIARSLVTVVEVAQWKVVLNNNAQWLILKAAKQGKIAIQGLLKRLASRTSATQDPRSPFTQAHTP